MEEQKNKQNQQSYLMNKVLFSTLSFGVLLFLIYIVNDIIPNTPYKYLKLVESDPAKFFQYIISVCSWDFLSFPLILTILPMIGFFITIAALSLTLKQRVPVATAVLSVIIFWLIHQRFWFNAMHQEPIAAILAFIIFVPFFGGFSGVVAFVPLFFIENYLKRSKEKKNNSK